MSKIIRDDCQIYKNILEVEDLMSRYGILITGSHMELSVGGKSYNIGRDSCEFPRQIDEPFWRSEY